MLFYFLSIFQFILERKLLTRLTDQRNYIFLGLVFSNTPLWPLYCRGLLVDPEYLIRLAFQSDPNTQADTSILCLFVLDLHMIVFLFGSLI